MNYTLPNPVLSCNYFQMLKSRFQPKDKRQMLHYQYVAWPDHGVPKDPAPCIQGIKDIGRELDIHESRHKHRPPIIVHCSAGKLGPCAPHILVFSHITSQISFIIFLSHLDEFIYIAVCGVRIYSLDSLDT